MASSEIVWAQAWSEPNAGSDLAAIRSTGVLSDDGRDWVLNGQKIWASRAVWADWCFGIFRTDPEAERHRGLTFVLVPLDSPGVTVRPIAQLDGDTGFAEIFFDDVRVPVENTLGEVNQGWRVAMATAGFERGVSLRSPARFSAAADRLVALWREHADPSDDALRDAVADAWMQAEGYKLHTYMTVTHMIDGGTIGAEASLNKIFWSEMDVRIHELALDIVGSRRRTDGRTRSSAGSTASCSRCPDRSTRAPTRSSATSSPTACSSCRGVPDAVRVHRRSDAVRRGVARPARQGVPAGARARRVGRRRRPRRHRSGTISPRWACSACSCPRPPAASGVPRSISSCCSRSSGVPPCRALCSRPRPSSPRARRRGGRRHRCPRRFTVRPARARRVRRPRAGRCAAARGRHVVARRRASTVAGGSSPSTDAELEALDYDEDARVRPRRAGRRRVPGRPRRAHDRRRRRVRPPARAVRTADRGEPGGEAPARRRAAEGRVRQARGLPRGLVGRGARADTQPRRVDGEGVRERRRLPHRAGARCRCTARSGTRGKRTSSSG